MGDPGAATAAVPARQASALHQDGGEEGGDKWSDLQPVLEAEPGAFTYRSDGKERRVRGAPGLPACASGHRSPPERSWSGPRGAGLHVFPRAIAGGAGASPASAFWHALLGSLGWHFGKAGCGKRKRMPWFTYVKKIMSNRHALNVTSSEPLASFPREGDSLCLGSYKGWPGHPF